MGPDAGGALASLCKGASTVISAIQGGPDIIIDGQTQLLRAARDAGVNRFIPSDYSLDLFKVKPGHIPTSEWRRQFALVADAERGKVEVVHVLNGGFLDRGVMFGFIRVIDIEKQTAFVWGDGKRPMDWTTYADTARYTVEVAVDERPVPSICCESVPGISLHSHGWNQEAGIFSLRDAPDPISPQEASRPHCRDSSRNCCWARHFRRRLGPPGIALRPRQAQNKAFRRHRARCGQCRACMVVSGSTSTGLSLERILRQPPLRR